MKTAGISEDTTELQALCLYVTSGGTPSRAAPEYFQGGTIPYLPAAVAKRDENRAGWPKTDPEAKCYMPGIPRATYMPFPLRIVQGDGEFSVRNTILQFSPKPGHGPHTLQKHFWGWAWDQVVRVGQSEEQLCRLLDR